MLSARMWIVVVIALSALGSACADEGAKQIARNLTGGDPDRGRLQIHSYGCATGHTIPGVMTATATVGPPLTQIGRRSYLAGRLENTPENMFEWIRHPRSVDDKTAMPDTGVTERDGRDIVAYLYTLR